MMMMMIRMIISVNPQTARISTVKTTKNNFFIGSFLACSCAGVLSYFRSDGGLCFLRTVSIH